MFEGDVPASRLLPRRVSDWPVCWAVALVVTTELRYRLTPSPLCTQRPGWETRLQTGIVVRLVREEGSVEKANIAAGPAAC